MANRLQHLSEFQKVLKTYQISDSSKAELEKTKLVLLIAPTSVGRNTIIKELEETGKYQFVLSDTTRKPRINDGAMEQNGKVYWFKSEMEILNGLKCGKYLEAAIIHSQQVSGMLIDEIEKAYAHNKVAIKDMEIQGLETYLKAKPDTVAIFVLPPSFKEWIRRIKQRGPMNDQEFKRRLNSAIAEFDYALKSTDFIFIVNDDLKRATEEIRGLVEKNQPLPKDQGKCRELVEELKRNSEKLQKSI